MVANEESRRKNLDQYKKLIMTLSGALNIAAHAGAFGFVWYRFYRPMIDNPFWNKGNFVLIGIYAVVFILFARVFGAFRVGYLRNIDVAFSQALAIFFTNIVFYLQLALINRWFMPPKFMLAMSVVQTLWGIIWVWFARKVYYHIYPPHQMIVVYGEYDYEDMLAKMERRHDKFHVRASINISEGVDKVNEVITNYESVILYDLPAAERNIILKYCFKKNIRVYVTPKISDIILNGTDTIHLFDTPLLLARNSGLNVTQRFFKRALDLFVAIPMLILTLPFTLIIAIIIHFTDGGPVFYKQERLTINHQVFMIYKFRSMRMDSEKNGARLAMKDDDRITPIGRFLRKTHLDELPQLLNILNGDMSVVGPRPERPEIAAEYEKVIPEFEYRLAVKAGLTGYAQVYGKYNTTPYDKLKLDLLYLENYSIFLDLKLILMTVKIIFQRENTEGVNADQITAQKAPKMNVGNEKR